jgi:hypothetical protein
LNDYVEAQIQQEGKKPYDKRKSYLNAEFGGMDLGGTQNSLPSSDLNFAPYGAPTRGYAKATADLPQSNPLFRPQEQEKKNDDGIVLQGGNKRWGA